MDRQLFFSGIAFVGGAIAGGGLKAFSIQMPVLDSPVRQVLLAAAGLLMIVGSFFIHAAPEGGVQVGARRPVLTRLGRWAMALIVALSLVVILLIPPTAEVVPPPEPPAPTPSSAPSPGLTP